MGLLHFCGRPVLFLDQSGKICRMPCSNLSKTGMKILDALIEYVRCKSYRIIHKMFINRSAFIKKSRGKELVGGDKKREMF